MKFYTCYALSDGIKKWLTIDELPAIRGNFLGETNRLKLIRQDLLVTIIVIDNSMSSKEAIDLTNHCFTNQNDWLAVDLKKSVAEVSQPKKSNRGRR